MTGGPPFELTRDQVAVLEKLLRAGFKFVTLEHVERYLGAEKNGFVALLDPSGGKFKVFGQVGYRMGNGIGVLVEGGAGKAFVRKREVVAASPELLATYERFKTELSVLLKREESMSGRQ
jgi:hypothetical protein